MPWLICSEGVVHWENRSVWYEDGANRQPRDASTMLLFKLVLEVVLVGVGSLNWMGNTHREHSNPLKSAD